MNVIAVRPLADTAVTFDLDERPGARAASRVHSAVAAIEAWAGASPARDTVKAIGSFASVTVHYDPLHVSHADIVDALTTLLENTNSTDGIMGRVWHLPCCYDGEHGADLNDLADRLSLRQDEIIAMHQDCVFDVFAMGFLPGLPFMGELPESLSLPRRTSPRQRVPKGSVAIAKGLCVIYPGASPGGWHIVGQCPVALFDAQKDSPALLAPGDRVNFQRVSLQQHEDIAIGLSRGEIDPEEFLTRRSER